MFDRRAVSALNTQFDGVGESDASVNGWVPNFGEIFLSCVWFDPGALMLLEHGSSSQDCSESAHALRAVASAGWWETHLKYSVLCEWASVTSDFMYDSTDLLAAILAATLCRTGRWFARAGHCLWWALLQRGSPPCLQDFLVFNLIAATLDAACEAWFSGIMRD